MKIHKYSIFAMANDRSYVEQKIRQLEDRIIQHIVKIGLYRNSTGDMHHWLSEISAFLYACNTYKVKPKGKKLKRSRYDDLLFPSWGEGNIEDMQAAVSYFLADNYGKYPDVEINDDTLYQVLKVYDVVRDYSLDLLPTMNNKTTSEILKDLEALLE